MYRADVKVEPEEAVNPDSLLGQLLEGSGSETKKKKTNRKKTVPSCSSVRNRYPSHLFPT